MKEFIKTTEIPILNTPNETMTILVNQNGNTKVLPISKLREILGLPAIVPPTTSPDSSTNNSTN